MCSKAGEKSKVVCKVCGSVLELTKKNHYVVTDNLKTGMFAGLAKVEEQWYDAFDCSVCGCQYIAGERKRKVSIEEILFDVLDELKEDELKEPASECFRDCSEVSISELNTNDKAPKTKLPSCFGKELEDADEECIGCEQLGECLPAPKCFGTKDGIKFVNEVCCKCNAKIRIKCSKIYNEIMKEEGLLEESLEEPSKEQVEKEIAVAKKQDERDKCVPYPICIGDEAIREEDRDTCHVCDCRIECDTMIGEKYKVEETQDESWEMSNEL